MVILTYINSFMKNNIYKNFIIPFILMKRNIQINHNIMNKSYVFPFILHIHNNNELYEKKNRIFIKKLDEIKLKTNNLDDDDNIIIIIKNNKTDESCDYYSLFATKRNVIDKLRIHFNKNRNMEIMSIKITIIKNIDK